MFPAVLWVGGDTHLQKQPHPVKWGLMTKFNAKFFPISASAIVGLGLDHAAVGIG